MEPRSGAALVAFLVPSGVFTLAHRAFVLILAHWMLPAGASLFSQEICLSIQGLLAALLLGFVSDLVGIRQQPFSWIRHLSDLALGRVIAIHLLLLGGIFVMAFFGNSKIVLGAILALKLLADLAGVLPPGQTREQPPWVFRFLARFDQPGKETFAEAWRRQRREEAEEHARAEQVREERKGSRSR